MKVHVLGNPIAGGGTARERIDRLARALEAGGHQVEVRLTGAKGDAARFAAEVPADADRLVVCGGDGTLNEALSGLEDPGRVPLLQLPAGTANILAHELDLPWQPEEAARVVVEGRVLRADLGLANGRRFLMVVSSGFDALVTEELSRSRKGTLGYLGYVRPFARMLRKYRPPRLEVTVDDGPPVPCGFVVISKTRNYGGLFEVASRARMDSGHLDVVAFPRASVVSLAMTVAASAVRKASAVPGARYLTGTRVRVVDRGRGPPTPWQIDGDFAGPLPLEVTLEPGRVALLRP